LLVPTAIETLRGTKIPKATPVFTSWSGPPVADTYGGKPVLTWDDQPAFAELVILWALKAVGWDGVWIDTYHNKFRNGYWNRPPIDLPLPQSELLQRIHKEAGSRFGAWDVFCWCGNSVLFAESKKAKHDSIRNTQLDWLDAAIRLGFRADDFLLVEWSI
jgi:hypothetical protein